MPPTRPGLVRFLALSFVVGAAVALYVMHSLAGNRAGADRPARRAAAPQGSLLPYQRLVETLPFDEQMMFEELQDAVLIAERHRAETGGWPDAELLATRGVSPFAPGPVSQAKRWTWGQYRTGLVIHYLGIPSGGGPAWLLAIVEPDPAAPPDTAPNDEEHHRLPDGTVLHISVWKHPEGPKLPAGFVMAPHLRGWLQLFRSPPAPPR
jgi:hypothetical protein